MHTENLCRIGDHWCTECCEGMNCTNLGQINKNMWGCLGQSISISTDVITTDGLITVFPKPATCKIVSCEDDLPADISVDQLRLAVESLPSGEFVMSHVISNLANKNPKVSSKLK